MSTVDQHWYSPDKRPAWYLIVASKLFQLASFTRRLAFRLKLKYSYKAPVPVIVVGNITVGGTGKTPLVIYLAQQLQAAGYKVGIISRGYGADIEKPTLVSDRCLPEWVGDEPAMMARVLDVPIMVCPDRVASVKKLIKDHGCDLIISDDGLQHYRLQRDVEIAVIDGARGVGNGYCLPAGPLREPVKRLNSVDMVVVNGELTAKLAFESYWSMYLQPDWQLKRVNGKTDKRIAVFKLKGSKVHAFAGIGNPARFFELLKTKGLTIIEHPMPDHYIYKEGDIQVGEDEWVVMTQKDALKCRPFADDRHWYLQVNAELSADFLLQLKEKIES